MSEKKEPSQFDYLITAVKMFEEDGIDAFKSVSEIYGKELATALLLNHMMNNKEILYLVKGANLIHEKGLEAFPHVLRVITDEEALALIIAHLRYQKSSNELLFFDEKINQEIVEILEDKKINLSI